MFAVFDPLKMGISMESLMHLSGLLFHPSVKKKIEANARISPFLYRCLSAVLVKVDPLDLAMFLLNLADKDQVLCDVMNFSASL